jgi:hypothetical protein
MESGNEIKQGKIKRNEWGVILSHPFPIYPYTLSFPYSPFLSHRKVTTFFDKVTTFSSPPTIPPHQTLHKSYNFFLAFIHKSYPQFHIIQQPLAFISKPCYHCPKQLAHADA